MKRILHFALLSMLLMVCGYAQAQTEVTFDATVDKSSVAGAADDVFVTKDGVTITVSNGILGNGTDYRCYKGQTLTVSSTVGSISNIVFECTANATSKYGPGCYTVADGSYSYDGKVGTWTGDAESVVFTAVTNQVRMTKIVVTVASQSGNYVPVPAISGDVYFLKETTVSISSTEEGTKIFYTTDGTEPTEQSIAYSAPFALNASATVKAIAVKDGTVSKVAEKDFTLVVPVPSTIAELNEKNADEPWILLTLKDALVTYVDGKTCYVRENDKALMFYLVGLDVNAGDVINGSVLVDYANYRGIHEVKKNVLTDASTLSVVAGTAPVEPTVATLDEILDFQHINDLVIISNAKITKDGSNYYAVNGDSKVQLYKGISVADYADNDVTYYIVAVFNAIYNGNAELMPVIVSENNPTAIEAVAADKAQQQVIFNLAGQRINQLQKGINILGGKKVLVK